MGNSTINKNTLELHERGYHAGVTQNETGQNETMRVNTKRTNTTSSLNNSGQSTKCIKKSILTSKVLKGKIIRQFAKRDLADDFPNYSNDPSQNFKTEFPGQDYTKPYLTASPVQVISEDAAKNDPEIPNLSPMDPNSVLATSHTIDFKGSEAVDRNEAHFTDSSMSADGNLYQLQPTTIDLAPQATPCVSQQPPPLPTPQQTAPRQSEQGNPQNDLLNPVAPSMDSRAYQASIAPPKPLNLGVKGPSLLSMGDEPSSKDSKDKKEKSQHSA